MKIVDLRVHLASIGPPPRTWVFVEIETEDGIVGYGEATNQGGGGAFVIGRAYELLRDDIKGADFSEGVVGQDADHIERIWQMIYRRFGNLGSRGFATTLCSGIDMALWDIKGKATARPVYDLLGGPVRDAIRLYIDLEEVNGSADALVLEAKIRWRQGYRAMKLDPFNRFMRPKHRRYIDGRIPPAGADIAELLMSELRTALDPSAELMIDAHGNFDLPTATRMCERMEKYGLTWFEEPLQPEGIDSLLQLKRNTSIPLCVGERKYTRWDFLPVLRSGTADVIMPDVCWSGGISEIRKIAAVAETYYVPVSPHGSSGPLNLIAGAHAMMATPNFYGLEYTVQAEPFMNSLLTRPLDIRDGWLHMSRQPGLGYELNLDYLRAHRNRAWEEMHGR